MFSLKSNLFFSMLIDAKDYARKLNLRRSHPPNLDMNPRELNRMQSELRAAREQARLRDVLRRNRIF